MDGVAHLAEDDWIDDSLCVEKDTSVRVQSLPRKYQAVSHSSHRRKSPWTEMASQGSKILGCFSVIKERNANSDYNRVLFFDSPNRLERFSPVYLNFRIALAILFFSYKSGILVERSDGRKRKTPQKSR